MKAMLISLMVLAVSSLAFANVEPTGIKTFPVTKAEFAPAHVEAYQSAELTINYDEKLVTLAIQPAFHCPDGKICAQVMPPAEIIELPIVSVERDQCGSTQVIAQEDLRIRDGIFQQLEIIDNSTMLCRILLPYKGIATYTTSAIDRETGEEVKFTSKMILSGRQLPRIKF